MKTISKYILTRVLGLKIKDEFPDVKKSIIIFVSHTSYYYALLILLNDLKSMTDIQHFRKKDAIDSRLDMSNYQQAVPKSKLSSGSTADKYPVILDDGKTVVYIKDKSREREIRMRYGLRKG